MSDSLQKQPTELTGENSKSICLECGCKRRLATWTGKGKTYTYYVPARGLCHSCYDRKIRYVPKEEREPTRAEGLYAEFVWLLAEDGEFASASAVEQASRLNSSTRTIQRYRKKYNANLQDKILQPARS